MKAVELCEIDIHGYITDSYSHLICYICVKDLFPQFTKFVLHVNL